MSKAINDQIFSPVGILKLTSDELFGKHSVLGVSTETLIASLTSIMYGKDEVSKTEIATVISAFVDVITVPGDWSGPMLTNDKLSKIESAQSLIDLIENKIKLPNKLTDVSVNQAIEPILQLSRLWVMFVMNNATLDDENGTYTFSDKDISRLRKGIFVAIQADKRAKWDGSLWYHAIQIMYAANHTQLAEHQDRLNELIDEKSAISTQSQPGKIHFAVDDYITITDGKINISTESNENLLSPGFYGLIAPAAGRKTSFIECLSYLLCRYDGSALAPTSINFSESGKFGEIHKVFSVDAFLNRLDIENNDNGPSLVVIDSLKTIIPLSSFGGSAAFAGGITGSLMMAIEAMNAAACANNQIVIAVINPFSAAEGDAFNKFLYAFNAQCAGIIQPLVAEIQARSICDRKPSSFDKAFSHAFNGLREIDANVNKKTKQPNVWTGGIGDE